MKVKNSGFTASGKTRPKFMHGDIYRDKYGSTVMIKGVSERRITYRREGYKYDCVMPVYQFQRDFTLVDHRETVNQNRAARYIRKIREMMVTGGKK
ncbi:MULTISPECIES: DUF4222 domain-containing protein [Enterobacteriaceae]|jgi:ADP-dependent phosphofructokinase/glucokinase|uniref:DUF4222 domain-containing protein n=1 Tax=Enterobacteriaceae TaxID=543 RepID=UPI0006787049|nr:MULTISPECIES: DUF4222 domain-containing protein [Enterobacteriaceae]EBA7791827.1 DUF4222 domain-containing protein [Salmonella enterica]EBF7774192.1 DUF4222 domain-containing protein [Salmonella enterica subsp. enterica serovar Mbandaka]EFA4481885.1 DUF4222 domain-containing protein [Escherichia coli O2]EFN8709292.1 DUF4222 domain-containing protein [Escherichia coli O130]EBS4728420.1 DUF4222 domain-containing protein [Salmonella enterica subsp. enterica serovar Agona]